MKFIPLSLDGAFEVHLKSHKDPRGYFARFFCETEFAAHGLNIHWVQMNISVSHVAGTLRGFHFQRGASAEVKLVRCLRGRAYDVIVDLRDGSPGYGQHLAVELDASLHNAIYIPKGFAHGFQTLEDEVELQYLHSSPYSKEDEGGVNVMSEELEINWPLPLGKLSDRDAALPPLSMVSPL